MIKGKILAEGYDIHREVGVRGTGVKRGGYAKPTIASAAGRIIGGRVAGLESAML